jgi:hypothetical protein
MLIRVRNVIKAIICHIRLSAISLYFSFRLLIWQKSSSLTSHGSRARSHSSSTFRTIPLDSSYLIALVHRSRTLTWLMLTICKPGIIRLVKPLWLNVVILLLEVLNLALGILCPLLQHLILIEHANKVNVLLFVIEFCQLIVSISRIGGYFTRRGVSYHLRIEVCMDWS